MTAYFKEILLFELWLNFQVNNFSVMSDTAIAACVLFSTVRVNAQNTSGDHPGSQRQTL